MKQFPNGPGGGIVRLLTAIHGTEHRFQILRLMARQGHEIFYFHVRLGNGAGFVHAQHIHPGQGLNAVHILHQHLLPAQLQRRGRHGNGGQQVQPLGNHPHQGRHSAFHTIPEVQLQHGKFLVKQHQSHRNQGNAQHQNQLVQRTHHFGFAGFGIFLGLPGELAGKSLRPHRRQLHPAPSRHYNAAGAQNVPGHMGNGFGFSGNQGFIQPQLPLPQNAVGTELVTLGKFGNVIAKDFLRGNLHTLALPDHRHRALRHQGQPIHRPLGPDLLNDADDGIDGRHHQKSHIQYARAADHQ